MKNSKFYFYDVSVKKKEGSTFNWITILDSIQNETISKNIHYEQYEGHTISIQIIKPENTNEDNKYYGYVIIGEADGGYQKEKKGDFLELELEDDESLCHINRGKLAFTINIINECELILMFEKQYFSLNIKGALEYFNKRYDEKIEKIKSKTKIGKDLKNQIINLKNNKVNIAKISFKKFATEDRVREFGFVEDAIPNLLEQGIHADLILKWDKPLDVITFFKNFFKKETFEDALDVDFGEFLKQFTFDTDNDAVPTVKMLDKLLCVTLPFDKTDCSEETLFSTLNERYNSKKDKFE